MKISDVYCVKSIKSELCKDWLLNVHYAKRMPSISFSFGLFKEGCLQGVLTIGKPASNSLCIGVCGKYNSKFVYELNRLCVNDGLEKNVLSYFVSKCLKSIDNKIIVSYADTAQNHHGYIYQATNWLYTGATKERTDIGGKDNSHSRHYDKKADYSKNRKFRSSKHRYIYLVANKKQKAKWLKDLNYDIVPYPKGENKRYAINYKPQTQSELF